MADTISITEPFLLLEVRFYLLLEVRFYEMKKKNQKTVTDWFFSARGFLLIKKDRKLSCPLI